MSQCPFVNSLTITWQREAVPCCSMLFHVLRWIDLLGCSIRMPTSPGQENVASWHFMATFTVPSGRSVVGGPWLSQHHTSFLPIFAAVWDVAQHSFRFILMMCWEKESQEICSCCSDNYSTAQTPWGYLRTKATSLGKPTRKATWLQGSRFSCVLHSNRVYVHFALCFLPLLLPFWGEGVYSCSMHVVGTQQVTRVTLCKSC